MIERRKTKSFITFSSENQLRTIKHEALNLFYKGKNTYICAQESELIELSSELKKQLDESTKKVQELLVSIEQRERAQPILVHLIAEYLYNVFCSLLNNSYKNLIEYNKIHTFASQVLAKPLHNAQIERGILYKGCSKN